MWSSIGKGSKDGKIVPGRLEPTPMVVVIERENCLGLSSCISLACQSLPSCCLFVLSRRVVSSCCLFALSRRRIYRISLILPCSLLAATRGRVLPRPLPRTGRHVGPTHPAHTAVIIHGMLVRRIQQVGKRQLVQEASGRRMHGRGHVGHGRRVRHEAIVARAIRTVVRHDPVFDVRHEPDLQLGTARTGAADKPQRTRHAQHPGLL